MCETTTDVAVLAGPRTRSVDEPYPARVPIDACVAEEIASLNAKGVRTLGSCCGHGAGAGWVAIVPEDSGLVLDLGYDHVSTPTDWPNYAGSVTIRAKTGGD